MVGLILVCLQVFRNGIAYVYVDWNIKFYLVLNDATLSTNPKCINTIRLGWRVSKDVKCHLQLT